MATKNPNTVKTLVDTPTLPVHSFDDQFVTYITRASYVYGEF